MKFKEFLNEHNINYIKMFSFSLSASNKYKTYEIDKKNGGKRRIFHPSKELKNYQKILSKYIFEKLPVHENVFSYKKNISIGDLALKHQSDNFLLRIDFTDFFPSLTSSDIRVHLKKNSENLDFEIDDNDITLINLIVCRFDKLTIGAPSSPSISNTLLYDFDCRMSLISSDINYSRYADDLYFTSKKNNILKNVFKEIEQFKSENKIALNINTQKTINSSKKHFRAITGLVITSENKVSIGRDKKRYIKGLVNKYINNNLSIDEINYLKGYLSFVKSVEKSFLINLEKKYNKEIINKLVKG